MENQEEKHVLASVVEVLPEQEKGKVINGKADVNSKLPMEMDEIIEIMTNNFSRNVLSEELYKKVLDNFNRRMTDSAIHRRDELKRQSDARNKKIIDEGPSK